MDDSPQSWRVLITGGSGFIGTNLVERYRGHAEAVMNLDQAAPACTDHMSEWKQGDVVDAEGLVRTVQEFAPTHVLHMAARTDLRGPSIRDYRANTDGVSNLIAALSSATPPRRVVFASSRLVCEIGYEPRDEFDVKPTTAYGASKVEGEQIARRAEAPFAWTILRPTSIWGPWFGTPYLGFFRAVALGRYVHPRNRRIRKSFGYVGNTVEQLHRVLAASEEAIAGRTLYLGDYPPLELRSWAATIAQLSGAPRVREVPASTLKIAARTGDVLGRLGVDEPPLTTFRLKNLLAEMVHDLTPLEGIAGSLPFSERAGVAETLRWMRSQGHL